MISLKDLFFPKETYSKEVIDILRLIRTENVGNKTFYSLIKLYDDATTALAHVQELSIKGGRIKPIKIYSIESAEKEIEELNKVGAKFITYKDNSYSKLLFQISDPPPVITYKGNKELFNAKSLSIVGARNASANSRYFTRKLTEDLCKAGYVIVSGLARGIDTEAHKASVESGTIGVLAGGIDHIYPLENKQLYKQIATQGLLIAELKVGSVPLGQHFPQRNRLISGLSIGTIIIEASTSSGSLITAKFAIEQNREVFAVPGFPGDPRSRGTNKLIKSGAILVESVEDIINNLPKYNQVIKQLEDQATQAFSHMNTKIEITNEMRKQITELISISPTDIDAICEYTSFPLPVIYTVILELELAGKIIRYPGNKVVLYESYNR